MSLTLKSVTKKFGNKEIIRDFSYDFPDCGLFLLVGESGAGKTTLLRLVSGLDKSYLGEISGGGLGKCSVAFQEYRLFPTLSALDNVAVVLGEKIGDSERERARAALLTLGLTEESHALLPSQLSGGMKVRVSLARAFVKDAPLLLLDEPTKELDTENLSLVLSAIEKEAERRLVIAVTHDRELFSQMTHTEIELKKL